MAVASMFGTRTAVASFILTHQLTIHIYYNKSKYTNEDAINDDVLYVHIRLLLLYRIHFDCSRGTSLFFSEQPLSWKRGFLNDGVIHTYDIGLTHTYVCGVNHTVCEVARQVIPMSPNVAE